MNIFADFHHDALFNSFKLLFEKRLGHRVYRPIGTEWFTEGFWKIAEPYNNNQGTIDQFLKPYSTPTDGTKPLNEQLDDCLTLEQFKEMDIDIVIATIPAHIQPYKRLISQYKPNAKFIYQMGNIGWHKEVPWDQVDNLMASVKPFEVPENKNVVFYRQEFDLDIFRPQHLIPNKTITSFVNCLPEPEKYGQLKAALPEYLFNAFGGSCPDGSVVDISTIATFMNVSKFGYHNKPYGDGYGHVIHNWFACGIPIIVNMKDYEDKLAGELLEDGVTCINLDLGVENTVKRVRNMCDLEYLDMQNHVINRFQEVVNFRQDAENVKDFISKL